MQKTMCWYIINELDSADSLACILLRRLLRKRQKSSARVCIRVTSYRSISSSRASTLSKQIFCYINIKCERNLIRLSRSDPVEADFGIAIEFGVNEAFRTYCSTWRDFISNCLFWVNAFVTLSVCRSDSS